MTNATNKKKLSPIQTAALAGAAFLAWIAVTVLSGIGFGAWLEAIGWSSLDSAAVSIFLWLVVTSGVPVTFFMVYDSEEDRR